MKQYIVTGLHCAACAARVEQAVSHVEGVESCSVNLLTNSMGVNGEADEKKIIKAVEDAGYGAYQKSNSSPAEISFAQERKALKRRLFLSVIFLVFLIFLSLGSGNERNLAWGIGEMITSTFILIIYRQFFLSGIRGALHRSPNMDTLVALGSSASFLWSVYALFTGGDLYFDSAAMILVLITIGKLLESKSKGKATDALASLMKLTPRTAVILQNGREETIPIGEIKVGDTFLLKPGESVPADGIILTGRTSIDESALTGESIPVSKNVGDSVSCATINQEGSVTCMALHVGEDTSLAKIIQLVGDTAATKAPIARIADKVSSIFVPVICLLSLVTWISWLIAGQSMEFALARAISVLVISCPCALGLATPVAIMAGSGRAFRSGILFQSAQALEEAGKITIAAFDKTGTITTGTPSVVDILPHGMTSKEELLAAACALEKRSEHPLAHAIVKMGADALISPMEIQELTAIPGSGISGTLSDGRKLYGGSLDFIHTILSLDKDIDKEVHKYAASGLTPVLFSDEEKLLGIITIADTLKEDAEEAVSELRDMGITPVVITGDNAETAHAICSKCGIEKIVSDVKPEEKELVVRKLKEIGSVMMIGDGINDAPALVSADLGMAMGTGTDIAIDAADIVLMQSNLKAVPAAIRLSRITLRNIKENLFWAFFYNILCIPLAAGLYMNLTGWVLNPMIAAAAMSISSLFVVTNALRLTTADIASCKKDQKRSGADEEALDHILLEIFEKMEEKKMIKKMTIEGMMCIHCEAHTKKALEAIDGVESATASHTDKNAIVTLSKDVDDSILKAAVEEAGYEVFAIE